jgi:hypothetical protein
VISIGVPAALIAAGVAAAFKPLTITAGLGARPEVYGRRAASENGSRAARFGAGAGLRRDAKSSRKQSHKYPGWSNCFDFPEETAASKPYRAFMRLLLKIFGTICALSEVRIK